mmetsp:Transcript_41524/g.110736  ORF Transcript_41524/g.110736 Transcript_41524/m.110736 type:complete len:230 (+) Transcript_41524:118-807(+)
MHIFSELSLSGLLLFLALRLLRTPAALLGGAPLPAAATAPREARGAGELHRLRGPLHQLLLVHGDGLAVLENAVPVHDPEALEKGGGHLVLARVGRRVQHVLQHRPYHLAPLAVDGVLQHVLGRDRVQHRNLRVALRQLPRRPRLQRLVLGRHFGQLALCLIGALALEREHLALRRELPGGLGHQPMGLCHLLLHGLLVEVVPRQQLGHEQTDVFGAVQPIGLPPAPSL